MRRINITKVYQQIAEHFSKHLFAHREFVKPIDLLVTMRDSKSPLDYGLPVTAEAFYDYLNKIIDNYERILRADDQDMLTLIGEFEMLIPSVEIETEFHKDVVKAMRYDDLRSKEFLFYLKKMQIKTCVYCHSQLTITFDISYYNENDINHRKGDVKEVKGLLELDHKYPKSRYPFLCTSFFNLYPVCGHCNKAKSNTPASFNLYTDSVDKLDIVKFRLDPASVLKYCDTKNAEDICINTIATEGEDEIFQAHNKMFRIQNIYDTQKDVAEELIHKAQVYTKSYNNTLIDNFKKLFPDQSILNRLIVGNYAEPSEILLRPMAKFYQDIAQDLKLLPNDND